ncbi:carboxypeptidase-like regulatory domain-containing protein [Arcticibacter tournemirensis]|uniref:Carboxypeptidase-like regulatory domain-containing protein n=1 Tax=Arcticibacter tournemirensis TaxID=699437 RepID=A0A5M9H670_9SPHI|nr:carboxypeptidase regulatory-like domain-containing protein [Arcticibacter tournemirensis]KAA8482426.1 carboxypeptidase-like regulatory domain-containing protein [Arcticibacter tournemirensis]
MGTRKGKMNSGPSPFWLLLVGMWLITFRAQAQVLISGEVTSGGKPVGGVRVDLRLPGATGFLGYTFTSQEGKYQLRTQQSGKLSLHFRALSYKPVIKEIGITQQDTVVNIELVAGGVEQLQEVVINARRPYRIGKDTIELDVKSFLRGDERTVEDLLKKIPGLNVGTDGSIKIGEKEVEKVMVEGDDFFEKGYRLLTQNMSVQPLDKVQVLQRYSNNKHLKGIENSDKVALNLQLKENSRSRWLGSLSASGSVTEPLFYQGSINLMNFGKRSKYYVLGSANNNGVDAVSSINNLLYPGQSDEPGQIGIGVMTPTLIDYTPDLPDFDYKRTNFNHDRLLSFNTILNPSKNFKIKWLGFANPTKKSFYRNTVQEYHIEDIQFTNTELYKFHKKTDNYFSRLELQYDINTRATLTYTGNLGSLGRNDSGDLLFNGSGTAELTKTQGILTNHNLTHTFKLSPREAIVSSARWILQKSPLDYSIDEYYYEDLFQVGGIANINQHAENNLQYMGVTSHYVRRQKGGDYIEFAIANEYKDQELVSDFVLLTEDGSAIRTGGFSNQLSLVTNNTSVMAKYTVKRRKWEWTPLLNTGFVHSSLHTYGTTKRRENWLISPGLLTKWTLNPKGKLEAQLSFSQTNTQLMEVVPNYFNTGIRNFVKGLDNMATLSSSEGTLMYSYGNMLDKFFANFSIGYRTMFDYISNQSMISPSYNLTKQVLLKDKKNWSYNAQFNYYVTPLGGNFKLDAGAEFSDYETGIAGVGNRQIHSGSHNYGLSFKSVWRSKVNIYTGSSLQFTSFRSESTSRLKNTYSFLNIFFKATADIQAHLKNEVYRFGDFLSQTPKTYYFSDLSFSYDVKKIKTRFDISARNLFNNRYFKNAVITDTYRAVTEYRLLPRYISIGLDHSF